MPVGSTYGRTPRSRLRHKSTIERLLSNLMDKRACSPAVIQPFSPPTPVLAQWVHVHTDQGGRDGGQDAWVQQCGFLPTSVNQVLNRPTVETSKEAQQCTVPSREKPAASWQAEY